MAAAGGGVAAQYAEDVWSLLDQLSVDQPAIVAISGGGPYAANVAATRTDRVRSMHLACALSEFADPPAIPVDVVASDPVAWWRFPPNSPTHVIPGFVDTTIEEATRGVFARGRDQPPHGLSQAFEFYRDTPLPDLSALQIPAFLYWGTEDKALSLQHLERWRAALPNVQATRLYVGEGHDIQYRHWDQILTDIAHLGQRIVICFEGRTVLVPPDRAPTLMAAGATLGLCAWH